MYNYKLIDKINIYPDKSIVIVYLSGYRKILYNKPLYYYIKNKQLDGKAIKYSLEFINDYLKELKEYNKNKNIFTFRKMIKILKNNNNGYYDFSELKNIKIDNEIFSGTLYYIQEPLKLELRKKIESNFKNVKFLYAKSEYINEVLNSCIFIIE